MYVLFLPPNYKYLFYLVAKYALLGSLRSTASMVSYELILSASVLTIILLTGSFSFINIMEAQRVIWFIIPLLPLFIMFFIAILAETNRTPFDLPEAKNNRFGLYKF